MYIPLDISWFKIEQKQWLSTYIEDGTFERGRYTFLNLADGEVYYLASSHFNWYSGQGVFGEKSEGQWVKWWTGIDVTTGKRVYVLLHSSAAQDVRSFSFTAFTWVRMVETWELQLPRTRKSLCAQSPSNLARLTDHGAMLIPNGFLSGSVEKQICLVQVFIDVIQVDN